MCAHVSVLTGRVFLRSQKLLICFQILMSDSVKSLKKSNRELKKQLEEAKKELKKLEQRVTDQECIVRNVNGESSASAILNREAESSLEIIGQEFDGTKLQLQRIGESLTNIAERPTNFEERLLNLESTFDDLQN